MYIGGGAYEQDYEREGGREGGRNPPLIVKECNE